MQGSNRRARAFCESPVGMRREGPRARALQASSTSYSAMIKLPRVKSTYGQGSAIWPESRLSHREGAIHANVSDFKNVSRCSKVKVKIECGGSRGHPDDEALPHHPYGHLRMTELCLIIRLAISG